MSAWHLTQALLSNSPLQTQVIRMMDTYGFPENYKSLVQSAQDGSLNPLTVLEADMSMAASTKYGALYEMGRNTWLDSLGVDPDSLRVWHQNMPAGNNDLATAAVYQERGATEPLSQLAMQLELDAHTGLLYQVLRKWADAEGDQGWANIGDTPRTFLEQASVIPHFGSAHAAAWLQALGGPANQEQIILPDADRRPQVSKLRAWPVDEPVLGTMEVFPNPSNGLVNVLCDLPADFAKASIIVYDASGRRVQRIDLVTGIGLLQVNTSGWSPGVYAVQLVSEGALLGSEGLVVTNQ